MSRSKESLLLPRTGSCPGARPRARLIQDPPSSRVLRGRYCFTDEETEGQGVDLLKGHTDVGGLAGTKVGLCNIKTHVLHHKQAPNQPSSF